MDISNNEGNHVTDTYLMKIIETYVIGTRTTNTTMQGKDTVMSDVSPSYNRDAAAQAHSRLTIMYKNFNEHILSSIEDARNNTNQRAAQAVKRTKYTHQRPQ